MALILPPSLDRRQPTSSASVQADRDCLCFPQISDQQFLLELRESQRPVALINGKEVPLLASNLNTSTVLGGPLNLCPPGDWLQAHLNQGVLESYLRELQSSVILSDSEGGTFNEKIIQMGKRAFETFLEAGSAAVGNQLGFNRYRLSLEDSEDLSSLVSRLHKVSCKDMGHRRRLRKDAEVNTSDKSNSSQNQDLDLADVEAVLGCGVTEPSEKLELPTSGWANGNLYIPPNLFLKLDTVLQKVKVSKRNRLLKRIKQGQAIRYSIFDFAAAQTAFLALGVTDPFLKFTNKKGLSFEGQVNKNRPLSVRYSGPETSTLRMRFSFKSTTSSHK